MPIYNWRCGACDRETEIIRAMSDYQVPPEKCDCGGTQFRGPLIERPKTCKGFILKEGGAGGFHDHEYTRNRSIK
jgi:putative FmdB family regulatory protein